MHTRSYRVALQRCDSYDRTVISELIDSSLHHIGMQDSFFGKTVLLKPNLISSSGPRLACTHSGFVAGAALWFLNRGAKVLLGDSPAFGSAVKVCRKQGITAALDGLDVKLVNFISPVRVKLSEGISVTVAREALECDLFVGLPKIKAHNQMFVSMAVKNIFGIVKGMNKAMLHMTHGDNHDRFAGMILDLVSLLPPQLHLADGIRVMHTTGPLDGEPLSLNCVASACCPIALDSAMLDLLCLDKTKSPLWRVAALRQMRGSNNNNLCFPLLSPDDFHGAGFKAPGNLHDIRFNPFRFLRGAIKKMILKVYD